MRRAPWYVIACFVLAFLGGGLTVVLCAIPYWSASPGDPSLVGPEKAAVRFVDWQTVSRMLKVQASALPCPFGTTISVLIENHDPSGEDSDGSELRINLITSPRL